MHQHEWILWLGAAIAVAMVIVMEVGIHGS